MSKTRDTGFLANVIQVHDTGVRIMSGSEMLMAISSSGAVTITGELSGSDAANTLLLSGTGSVGFTTTGSFNTASGSLSSRTSQIEAVYATTGSNSFRATQSITGSLTVTGQIIAQTLNVQQVTSSIVYSSGSNTFGCDINSRQTFTGSFYQTGSTAVFSNRVCSFLGNFTCLGVGTTCLRDTFVVSANGGAVLERFTGVDPYSGDLYFYSARGTSSSPTTKCNGDITMGIRPRAYDGTSYLDVAAIESKIDGAVSTNSMCGNLIFSTNGGTATLTERMRITPTGNVLIGTTTITTATAGLDALIMGKSGAGSVAAVFTNGGSTRWGFVYANASQMSYSSYGDLVLETGATASEKMRIAADGVAELKQYWKVGTGINSTCYLVVSENQIYRTGCGILYINNSATGQVSIASGGGVLTLGTNDQQSGYFLTTKNQGVTNANTYFGTGTVRIGGGSDHGGSTVLSVAPGVVTFDRPGVGGGALTINSSGYVTLPSQPSFLAASTAGQQDYTSGQVLVFNTTRHNTGSHYNTSTGRFTAPVAGRYLFSVNFYTYPSYRASITITINGSQYTPQDLVPLMYHENDVGSISSGFTLIFELSANDYVEVRSRAGYASRVYMSHSHFSGQLLS